MAEREREVTDRFGAPLARRNLLPRGENAQPDRMRHTNVEVGGGRRPRLGRGKRRRWIQSPVVPVPGEEGEERPQTNGSATALHPEAGLARKDQAPVHRDDDPLTCGH